MDRKPQRLVHFKATLVGT